MATNCSDCRRYFVAVVILIAVIVSAVLSAGLISGFTSASATSCKRLVVEKELPAHVLADIAMACPGQYSEAHK